MPFEVANIVRRSVLRRTIDPAEGSNALHDFDRLAVDLIPFTPLAARVWELRGNLAAYDAAYVAAAELVDAPLLTLDRRIAKAPGLRCPVLTSP